MTNIEMTISKINRELISAFALLDSWFDHEERFLHLKTTDRWSPADILEHVMLTNHYLLILIEKGCDRAKAIANDTDLEEALQNYQFDVQGLEEIGKHKSFAWERPSHMEPTGTRTLGEIRKELRQQLYRCLCTLDSLCRGEGILHHTTMSVNRLGKLDVYQYIYFLALHAKRHITQLEKQQIQTLA
jgi:hypothetical protein